MSELDLPEWLALCLKDYIGPHADEIIDGVREYGSQRASAAEGRIKELEEMLMSATMDGYDMAKNEYRSYIEELEAKLAKAVDNIENLIIAIAMGWDLEGVVAAARTTLEELEGQDNE